MICNNDYVTIWLYKNNARQRFHNNINVNRKCTRRGLWDGDIYDHAAIWCVLGRSLSKLGW